MGEMKTKLTLNYRGNGMKFLIALLLLLGVTACTDADIASQNLSKAADYFEIERRVVFYNGVTGDYILSIRGRCSVSQDSIQLAVTCKTGPESYKKHYLGLSDNVTYFAEQLESKDVNAYHYRVVFKPQTIIPDVELRASAKALVR